MISVDKLVFRTGLCMILVAFSTAMGVYDDARSSDMDEGILDHDFNYIDNGPLVAESRVDPVRDFVMYKLLKSQGQDDTLLGGDRTKLAGILDTLDNQQVNWRKDDSAEDGQKTVMKRPSDSGNGLAGQVNTAVKPQPKWKSKKGRLGSQYVCYFKLCSFRWPS